MRDLAALREEASALRAQVESLAQGKKELEEDYGSFKLHYGNSDQVPAGARGARRVAFRGLLLVAWRGETLQAGACPLSARCAKVPKP